MYSTKHRTFDGIAVCNFFASSAKVNDDDKDRNKEWFMWLKGDFLLVFVLVRWRTVAIDSSVTGISASNRQKLCSYAGKFRIVWSCSFTSYRPFRSFFNVVAIFCTMSYHVLRTRACKADSIWSSLYATWRFSSLRYSRIEGSLLGSLLHLHCIYFILTEVEVLSC